MWTLLVLLLGPVLGTVAASPAVQRPTPGECSSEPVGASLCIYRSLTPSAGIVESCRAERDCRVGYYYGNPRDAVWFSPPAGLTTFPKPQVTWLTGTLAQVRFDCGRTCSLSYFFDVRRRRLSEPRHAVLAVDPRRLLIAAVEGRMVVVRQLFSGREVLRLERDWSPAEWLGDIIVSSRFDPDGRLSLTWLRGKERTAISERVSVPSVPHS